MPRLNGVHLMGILKGQRNAYQVQRSIFGLYSARQASILATARSMLLRFQFTVTRSWFSTGPAPSSHDDDARMLHLPKRSGCAASTEVALVLAPASGLRTGAVHGALRMVCLRLCYVRDCATPGHCADRGCQQCALLVVFFSEGAVVWDVLFSLCIDSRWLQSVTRLWR